MSDSIADDAELLRDYCASRAEEAFRGLVERHLPAVWSAARRMVKGDGAMAEDIAQEVFAHLAVYAPKLPPQVVLGGWLHRHTCFTASKVMRAAARRSAREVQHAAAMTAATTTADSWSDVAPVLDAALNALPATDRDAVVLRFFEQRDFRSIADALGMSEDGARMKTARAVEKLRGILGKRGALLTVPLLTGLLTDRSVAAAPAGLAGSIVRGSLGQAAAAPAASGLAALLAKLGPHRAALTGGAVLLLAGLAVWWWHGMLNGEEPAPPRVRTPAAAQNAARPPAEGMVQPEMEVTVHYIHMPAAEAAALLDSRWNKAGDTALLKSLLQRAGSGVRVAAVLSGLSQGRGVTLERGKAFEYNANYEFDDDEMPVPEGTESRFSGSKATVELTVGGDGKTCDLNMELEHDFADAVLVDWPVSFAGPGNGKASPVQLPEFRSSKVTVQMQLTAGESGLAHCVQIPALTGTADQAPAESLLVFVTVQPASAP